MTSAAGSELDLGQIPDPRSGTRLAHETGLGGRFRAHNDEFMVEEIPLIEPSGEGEHLYVRIQKNGISHRDMINQLVRAFDVPETAIGYAGMKDRRAITQQTVSIQVDHDTVPVLESEGLQVFWTARHDHKLRRGQLLGNRFSIRIREVDPLEAPRAWQILKRLEQQGLPNAYMSQRFGYRLNNHRLGAAWLAGQWRDLLDEWLGSSGSAFPPSEAQARADYDAGRYQQAIRASGRDWWAERAALQALAAGTSPARACSEVPKPIRELWIDSVQATIFNHVLARRLKAGTMSSLQEGDIGWNHNTGRWFRLPEAGHDDPELVSRVESFEVSPTGPLPGRRMPRPGSGIADLERAAAVDAGVEFDRLLESGGARRGSRRPLRVPVRDVIMESGTDDRGTYLRVVFDLPRGAYATGVLSEIMGAEAIEERGWLKTD